MTAKQGLIPLIKSIAQTIASRLSPGANINGVLFDGSADITVPAAAGTLTGTTLASNVVNASLNSITPTSSALYVETATPALGLWDTGGGTNSKLWDMRASTGSMFFRVVNDASSSATSWMQVNRTATTVDSISIGGATGAESLRVVPVASSVNLVQAMGSATTGFVQLSAQGSDTNIPFGITSKGTGSVLLYTGNFARAGLVVANTASSVNHLVVYPNVTGSGPIITVDGADTNTNLTLQAKGTGIVRITSRINLASLPTSAAGLAAGDLWNDSGTLKVA